MFGSWLVFPRSFLNESLLPIVMGIAPRKQVDPSDAFSTAIVSIAEIRGCSLRSAVEPI